MLIDLDKHGTPGWLTPQGKFDNSAIRKKHRDAWLAKRKAIKDAGFDPNQPRDDKGRWSYVGTSKHVDAKKLEEMRKAIDTAADMLHYPKEKLHLSDGSSVMHLNGVAYYSGAVAVAGPSFTTDDGKETYSKGDIVFFTDQMVHEADVGAIAAHEIKHQVFEDVLREAADQIYGAMDLYGHDFFDENSGINPKHKDVAPLAWKLQEAGYFGKGADELVKNDGVTPYSAEYWYQFAGMPLSGTFKVAVHETLAEIAKLRYLKAGHKEAPVWTNLFDLVDREYRKLHNIKDYNPYHAPAGSPGGTGGQFTRAPGAKEAWIRQKIDFVADKMHFPKDRIHMSTGVYTFELGGETLRAAGIAVYSKEGFTQPDTGEHFGFGDVVIYDYRGTGFNEELPVHGIIAHEIAHQRYREVNDRAEEEFQLMVKNNPDVFKDTFGFDEPRKKYGGAYPTFFAMQAAGVRNDAITRKLIETDGVTAYSRKWWDEYEKDKTNWNKQQLAINETIAEIAALDIEGQLRNPDRSATYADLESFVRKGLEKRYEERKERMATPEEYEMIMSDPFAWADMLEPNDFIKRFGVPLDDIYINHSSRTITYEDYEGRSDKVILSPEWRKLYDTINEQYKNMHNITDAGFDPNQPRDDEGRWYSAGRIALGRDKLGIQGVKARREQWLSTKATDELYQTSYINPLNNREIVWTFDKEGKDLAMLEFGPAVDPETVYFKHFRTFPQRKGIGRAALKDLTDYADEKGVKLWLEVDQNSETPAHVLADLYREFGFEGDFDGMVRKPKTS